MASSNSFHGFTRQASFFLREKIKSARLALTDVTPAQLLIEEATNEDLPAPSTYTMRLISRAAFEVDDYWRIVDVLHKRLSRFDRKNWRSSYKALITLEHLLCHGPARVSEEFQSDKDVIREMGSFQYVDERGFNWGLSIRKKSENTLKLLEDTKLLKEERARSRKLAIGIKGFGSFNRHVSDGSEPQSEDRYGRCNSHPNNHHEDDDKLEASTMNENEKKTGRTEELYELCTKILPEKMVKSATRSRFGGEYKPLESTDSDHHQSTASLL